LPLADRTERVWRFESDSSRALRTASARDPEFDATLVMSAYRTQGGLCLIRDGDLVRLGGSHRHSYAGTPLQFKELVFVPVRLFTDAERGRLNRFPRDISPADLLALFTLSDDELELIDDRRGDHNRLGFGLQLKAMLYLGFVPDVSAVRRQERVVFGAAAGCFIRSTAAVRRS